MDFAGFVVALVGGTEDFAAQTRREILDRRVIKYQPPRCDGLLLVYELPPCTKERGDQFRCVVQRDYGGQTRLLACYFDNDHK